MRAEEEPARRGAGVLLTPLAAALLLGAAAAAAPLSSPDGSLTLEPPPGWAAVPTAGALFRLRGPADYSAVLSALEETAYAYNRQAVGLSLEGLLKRVDEAAGLGLKIERKLKHAALANGAEIEYRLAGRPDAPSLLLGFCRFSGRVLLVQVISRRPEEDLGAIVGGLSAARPGPAPPGRPAPAGPGERGTPPELFLLWLAALAAVAAGMTYHWREFRRPSRRKAARRPH